MKKNNLNTPSWGSRLGFIMTAAGAAIGLGNLQRFPQLVAKHGGGAFLLLYILCVLLFGLPLMFAELSIGRYSKSDPINSFIKAAPNNKLWKYVGVLGALIAFFILSYYVVSCSWTLAFMYKASTSAKKIIFTEVTQSPNNILPYLIGFHIFVTIVVYKGLNDGVEKFSKFVMPVLILIQIILMIKILTIEGSYEGIIFYLKPDFSKLHFDSLLNALSQAFFSLCIGEAVLLTYGSFSKKNDSLPLSAVYIAGLDTLVAVLAGLIVIPAAYLTNQDFNQGISLIYNTLLEIFTQMKGGSIFLILYFFILAIAGLTTCISLMDVSSHSFSKAVKISKKTAVLFISILSFVIALPSLYSGGGSDFFTNMEILGAQGFLNIMDFLWGSIGMVVSGLLITIFVGWIWGTDKAAKELSINSPVFIKISRFWKFHIKWTAPLIILYILKTLFLLV